LARLEEDVASVRWALWHKLRRKEKRRYYPALGPLPGGPAPRRRLALDLYYMPYTHSLVAALLWSVAAAATYRLLGRSSNAARVYSSPPPSSPIGSSIWSSIAPISRCSMMPPRSVSGSGIDPPWLSGSRPPCWLARWRSSSTLVPADGSRWSSLAWPCWLSKPTFSLGHPPSWTSRSLPLLWRRMGPLLWLSGCSRIGGPQREPRNKRVNLPVRPVTSRACARPAPVRPAGYVQRFNPKTDSSQCPDSRHLGGLA
jgi:hypothetical protein